MCACVCAYVGVCVRAYVCVVCVCVRMCVCVCVVCVYVRVLYRRAFKNVTKPWCCVNLYHIIDIHGYKIMMYLPVHLQLSVECTH